MDAAVNGLSAYHGELIAQRNVLDTQIQAVEQALQVLGAPSAAPRAATTAAGRRPGRRSRAAAKVRPGSLKSYILDVMAGGGVMAVKDITAGVLAAGYKTTNQTLAKSVGIALTELSGVEKVGRGRFRLR
jgi:uncharacterized Ntn-hydrolase superfamily protein